MRWLIERLHAQRWQAARSGMRPTPKRAPVSALFEAGRGHPEDDPSRLVIFPEMDESGDPPEITVACWGILNKNPEDIMCASPAAW
jgi:hypothetical protein